MKYILGVALVVLISVSIIPMLRFYISSRKTTSVKTRYVFTEKLINFDMDSLHFEDVDRMGQNSANRLSLADRGWIRCPNGTIMSNNGLGAKKESEYSHELP